MSCLINCLFWAPGDPKIMTNEDLKNLIDSQSRVPEFPGVPFLPQKLQVISDISADSNGSLEFVVDCTSMEEPFEVVDGKGSSSRDPKSPGVVVTSIDYLPGRIFQTATFQNCQKIQKFVL
ncbi:unnamed protein product [Oikopleura dioica]|uniref:Uncharacterized protein n=1 Tax=Oikopleura dioica TaxID=34765 RepID=E4YZN7_OIKDI|nr:unnamed protein product [Oikopleura dioica]